MLLDRKEVKPTFLSRLFGTSGLPLDKISKSWIKRAKKPLKIGQHSEAGAKTTAAATELEFVQQAIGLPLLCIVIWSAANPGRSLQDRLAGTWLVPR